MAQNKYPVQVTNGSQQVRVAGQNVAIFIKAGQPFMVVGPNPIPYYVAADATFNGTDTVFNLTGAYQGDTSLTAEGRIVTGKTPLKGIPTLAQGDVGTAAVFTMAMFQLEALLGEMPAGVRDAILGAFVAQNSLVLPTDTVTDAVGKLQGQHSAHIGSRGDVHATATQFEHGFMSAPDKQKIDAMAPAAVAGNPPPNPAPGQRWVSTNNGVTYTWVQTGATASAGAWVQAI